jgi:transcriptional regulator with XRE-family HTH domain
MIEGQSLMARFRARIEQLTLQKSAERGSRISQKELAEESGVPLPTLTRWYNKEFERIDADTVLKLKKYFGCTLDELIEVIE